MAPLKEGESGCNPRSKDLKKPKSCPTKIVQTETKPVALNPTR